MGGSVLVLLALGASICFGVGDFLGGFATRRAGAQGVVAISSLAGAVLLLPIAAWVVPGHLAPADLLWGGVAGLIGGAGLFLFFRGLAAGMMSIIGPITAVLSATLPVLFGIALTGERPPVLVMVGLGLALIAIGLLSMRLGKHSLSGRSSLLGPIGLALVAGTCFGLVLVLWKQTSPQSGLWPVAAARLVAGSVFLVASLRHRSRLRFPLHIAGLAAASGLLDMTANALYILAVRQGPISVVSILASLYPVTTVLLAYFVLRERLPVQHRLALAMAGVATTLILLR